MAWPKIPDKKLRGEVAKDVHKVAKDVRTAASRIGRVLDLGRQHEIDEFLRPLKHSRLGNKPVYTHLRALLEHRARHGQSPNEFFHEMTKRSEHVVRQYHHQIQLLVGFLRNLSFGANPHHLKKDVFMPLKTHSISAAEACRRLIDIADGNHDRGTQAPGAIHNNTQVQLNAKNQPSFWDLNAAYRLFPNFHPRRSLPPLLQPQWSLGQGLTGDIAAEYGVAGCIELLLYPGVYIGAEVSLCTGIELDAAIGLVAELAFCRAAQFGGYYFGVCLALQEGIGGEVQVSWSSSGSGWGKYIPQGISVAFEGGEGVEVDYFVGGGKVMLL